ncbi:hypothetical protein Syun_022946 [Stephania yunnanensis]|uniref:Uncharacterized protein n=1 Tax=Stephania yunnanensis TaxID=152371 RepID=A0AAP0I357_9MAGN
MEQGAGWLEKEQSIRGMIRKMCQESNFLDMSQYWFLLQLDMILLDRAYSFFSHTHKHIEVSFLLEGEMARFLSTTYPYHLFWIGSWRWMDERSRFNGNAEEIRKVVEQEMLDKEESLLEDILLNNKISMEKVVQESKQLH